MGILEGLGAVVAGIWLGVILLTQPFRTVLLCAAVVFSLGLLAFTDFYRIRGQYWLFPWGAERWTGPGQYDDLIAQWPAAVACLAIALAVWFIGRTWVALR